MVASSVTTMTAPRIDALGIVSSELDRTVAFYRALGCDVPEPTAEAGGHLDIPLGEVRLMIDTEEVIRSFSPGTESTGRGHVSLAARCASPAEVDQRHAELSELGSGSVLEPFDAFWGQRYASVRDPDGVQIDLYAPLVAES